jgi:hypothetical protein
MFSFSVIRFNTTDSALVGSICMFVRLYVVKRVRTGRTRICETRLVRIYKYIWRAHAGSWAQYGGTNSQAGSLDEGLYSHCIYIVSVERFVYGECHTGSRTQYAGTDNHTGSLDEGLYCRCIYMVFVKRFVYVYSGQMWLGCLAVADLRSTRLGSL